jgi:hypothetical protein
MRTSKATGIAVAIALMAGSVAALAQMNGASPAGSLAGANVVDARGNLHVPENYRTRYQALGSWRSRLTAGRGPKRSMRCTRRRERLTPTARPGASPRERSW